METIRAYEEGVLVVAAGNGDTFPSNCQHVLAVSASDRHDRITHPGSGSGYVAATAPGGSTYGAAAMLSGLASLELSRYPGYTVDQLAGAILFNSQDIGYQDNRAGYSRIDAYRAMRNGDTPCARRPEW